MLKLLPGINIQSPISELIASGEKIVETRTYEIPANYLNKEIYLIETPGKSRDFKARAIAIIKFTSCFPYGSKKEFYDDFDRHKVNKDSAWAWKDKPKWGWEVLLIKKIPPKIVTSKRGIVFTKKIELT
jgi:hypothetical protein